MTAQRTETSIYLYVSRISFQGVLAGKRSWMGTDVRGVEHRRSILHETSHEHGRKEKKSLRAKEIWRIFRPIRHLLARLVGIYIIPVTRGTTY